MDTTTGRDLPESALATVGRGLKSMSSAVHIHTTTGSTGARISPAMPVMAAGSPSNADSQKLDVQAYRDKIGCAADQGEPSAKDGSVADGRQLFRRADANTLRPAANERRVHRDDGDAIDERKQHANWRHQPELGGNEQRLDGNHRRMGATR